MSRYIAKLVMLLILTFGITCSNNAFSIDWKMPPDMFATYPANPNFDLSADPAGNAFTAYITSSQDLYVSRFSNVTQSYGPGILISPTTFQVAVATDATGTALVIGQNVTENIFTSFYNGTTWSPITILDSLTSFIQPSIDMNGSGNGLAAWADTSGMTAPGDIIVSFFDGGTQTFGPLTQLNNLGTGGQFPITNYSQNGTAVTVWLDAFNDIVASNYDGSLWSAVPLILSTNAIDHDVQIDAAGNALATWRNSFTQEYFSSYYNGVSWGAPVNVSLGPTAQATFALSPAGTALAAFEDVAGNGFYTEFIGGVWTAPLPFASNIGDSITVSVDSIGNALIAWDVLGSSTFSIYKPFGGPLEIPDIVVPDRASLLPILSALSDNGRAFISGSTVDIGGIAVTGTYTLFAIPPTPILSGRVCNNKFASQTDRIHIITWLPSADSTVTSYVLRRNGVIIAVIPAIGPFTYLDHNRCRRNADTYTLVAVTPLGDSAPSVVILR